jgi:hypothetical protein
MQLLRALFLLSYSATVLLFLLVTSTTPPPSFVLVVNPTVTGVSPNPSANECNCTLDKQYEKNLVTLDRLDSIT